MIAHETYVELVVGHALDALEPADEQLLLAHLPGCVECTTLLDDMRQVAADLAYGVADEEPPPQLLDHIRAVMAAEGPASPQLSSADLPQDPVTRPPRDILSGRRGRASRSAWAPTPPRWGAIAVAAAAALIAIAAIGGYALNQRSDRNAAVTTLGSEQQVLERLDQPGAYTVNLASGGAATGAAVVAGDQVYLVTHNLGENDVHNSIYVLWAQNPSGRMVALGGFDVHSDSVTVMHAALPASVGRPQLFGVTHEAGRTLPAVPGTSVLGASTGA